VVEEMPTDRLTRRVELTEAELERADAVVLVTDHDAFDYELVTKHARLVLDTRHRLDGPRVEQL
jgi:UDP-N-acetyl-D-glucosamine dehydrogenase